MKIACQAYTWQMSGDRWKGRVPEMLDAVQEAGYGGFETEFWFLGDYGRRPDDLRRLLEERSLCLVALGVAGCWTDPAKVGAEVEEARKAADFLSNFPGSFLLVAGGTSPTRDSIEEKFQSLFDCLHRIGDYALERGLSVGFHPHSAHGTIFASEADYDLFLARTDRKRIGFVPDAGHMARTGLDPAAFYRKSADRILYTHFKDYDGKEWVPMGHGIIDWKGILQALHAGGFDGWIVVEDESPEGAAHPARIIRANRLYMKNMGC